MRRLIATALVGLSLAAAPAAQAAWGENFGIADSTGPAAAAPAFPGTKAFWAGTCDLAGGGFAVGSDPGTPFAHCIDHPNGSGSNVLAPMAAGVPASLAHPLGWTGPTPAWRLDPVSQAGAHPDATASFWFVRAPGSGPNGAYSPDGDPRDILAKLPPGVVGNPGSLPKCPAGSNLHSVPVVCPPQSQVGVSTIRLGNQGTFVVPVYNVEPRPGATAEFILSAGSTGLSANIPIVARARTEGDFGIDTFATQLPTGLPLLSQTLTIWGVPWAAEHDRYRPIAGYCGSVGVSENVLGMPVTGLAGGTAVGCSQEPQRYLPAWGPIRPFFANPTECVPQAPVTTLDLTSWHRPGEHFLFDAPADAAVDGCDSLDNHFTPGISLEPSGHGADSPSGLEVELAVPQNNDAPFGQPAANAPQPQVDQYVADATSHWGSPAGLATPHLRDTVVRLPEGVTLNPAAANGLAACSTAQIGLTGSNFAAPVPIRFDNSDPSDGVGNDCPDASKLGTVKAETPLLDPDDWPTGEVYLARQNDNPFDSLLALYIVLRSPQRDLIVKLAGKVEADPASGQLTTRFLSNPQLPVSKFSLRFRSGPQAPLATPVTCGDHVNHAELTPWSANAAADTVTSDKAEFDVSSGPSGAPCPASKQARPFGLGFEAGVTSLVAGRHSPFTMKLTRPDGAQELDRIELTTPEGLAATLVGVPYCPAAAIAAAEGRDGSDEQASPSCPAASQVGTVSTGVGVGLQPFYASGKAYLAGPYKGAPLSLAVVVPALAGPFDLGTVVVRSALVVNPRTAQITAVSDPLPQRLVFQGNGFPLRLRDVRVHIDRPNFTLNPTDCSEQQVSARVFGTSGAVANLSNRFQVAECTRLGFKPKLDLRLIGGTKRSNYQRLKATLTARPGDANIARASVALPHSVFLAQEHINTVCTRVQFAADACPAGAIYGKASATSPLLDQPLSGPVYLRSSDNPLPDLVAALRGPDSQPIEIEVAGRTDSIHGGLRNTFDVVPDAPVTKFTLELFGGKKSLIVNSRDLCKSVQKATVKLAGQNGRTHNFRPVVRNGCGKPRKGKKGKGKKARAQRLTATQSVLRLARGLL